MNRVIGSSGRRVIGRVISAKAECRPTTIIFIIAISVLLLFGSGWAQSVHSETEPDLRGQMQLDIVDTSLLDYSASKLVLGLTLSISSKRDLTLEQIVLHGLRINGLPVYAAPLTQRLQLHSGEKKLLPDPLPVTIYLRDLDSVAPLEQAISTGHTTVDGTAYATVRVNPLAAMLLLSRHVDVAISVHEDVLPFSIPGGLAAKAAALVVLHAADKALRTISTKVTTSKDQASSFRRDAMKQYVPHLMLACAYFELRGAQSGATPFQWCGVALATAPDLVLVPREAIEPWKFDTDIADAIHGKHFSLNTASYDLWLWPASAPIQKAGELNPDTALRLSRKQFSVLKMPDHDEHKILALEDSGKTQKISVARRDSSSDLALLQVSKSAAAFGALPAAGDSSASEWDTVALFRFRDGLRGSSAAPELIEVPARRNGTRIELGELVDSSVFGSPIVAPEGVVGIVQDQSSGVTWAEAVRVLKIGTR
ncbi:MAG TPA: hypothetical protein VI685_23735 [Candidatus Angelobacter sp.]